MHATTNPNTTSQPSPSMIAFDHDAFDNPRQQSVASQDVDTMIALTARLAQVLAKEADLLAEMKVSSIESLQKEKLQLLEALEAQKRHLDKHPEILDTLSDEDCLELAQMVEIFQNVMKENYRRLMIAREVNAHIVEAIAQAVKEASHKPIYDKTGSPEIDPSASLSVNQRV